MKKLALTLIPALFIILSYSQTTNPDVINGFPKWNPFLDETNTQSNARDYYAPNPVYSDVLGCNAYCDEGVGSTGCLRKTLRYQFLTPNALDLSCSTISPNDDDDTNEKVDVYYSEFTDSAQETDGKPVMVILHPITGTRLSGAIIRRARLAAQRGYVVIVPDYTSASDPRWGNESLFDRCITQADMAYVFQTSVLDVSAAIRRVFDYYSTSNEGLTIDEDNIFVWGFSNGAITAMHLAYGDEIETQVGGQTVTSGVLCTGDNPCTFASDINETSIVGYETPCDELNSDYCDFDIRSRIKGVSAMAGYLLDKNMINSDDDIPLLLFHGTCDGVIPFDKPSGKQATFRRSLYRLGPDITAPCQSSSGYNYKFHGSGSLWERMNTVYGGLNQGPYRGFVKVCGVGHSMGADYSIAADPTIEMATWEYESLRFFSNILNNDRKVSFEFNLAQSLQTNLSDPLSYDNCDVKNNLQTRAVRDCRGCESVPQWSDEGNPGLIASKGTTYEYLDYLAKRVCPTCDGAELNDVAPAFQSTIRYPNFDINQTDDGNRYPALEAVEDDPGTSGIDESMSAAELYCQLSSANIVTDCPCEENNTALIELNNNTVNRPNGAKIVDALGMPVREIRLPEGHHSVTHFLSSDHGLSKGMYFIYFDTGERKAIVVQ